MNRTLRNVAATCAAVLTLTGATAMQASAAYLGYGNGDPGDWSFWQEQNGGPSATKPIHRASARHHQRAAQPTEKHFQPAQPAQPHYQNEKS